MKRRPRNAHAAKLNLLPFLDLLLCVMGALIVLLVVIAQRAQNRAKTEVVVDSQGQKLRAERDELSWRLEQVRTSRDQTAAQLAEQRAGLSHIEDHARRLREQYRALEQAARDLEKTLGAPSAASRELDAKLADLQRQMAIVAKELEAKRLAPQKAAGYAIVPYEGPNGTLRRPMYIECCDAGIILQPEGVVLTAEDFRGTLGPGNPLAAAMRAAREYLMRNQRGSGEPYPLLLIRPDGIGAYYVAREALSSWGSEFGYEFVDQEWNLEYPAPDPQLLAVTSAAAEDARQRQRLLLAAAPQAFAERGGGGGGSGEVVYRASPGLGGAMVDGGGGRRGSGRRGGGSAFGGDRDKESGGLSQGGFERSGAGDGDRESENSGQGRYAEKGSPQGSARGAGSRGSSAGSTRGSGSNRSGSAAAGGTSGEGQPGDGSPEMQLASRNAENKPGEEGEPLKPGQYVAKPESMAVKRGKDWGLKEQGPRAVPISRKIRVRCQNDRLVILSDDRGAKNEQTIVFGPRAEDSVEEFVSKVWTHMDRWGIAGENMFWKPQLQFDVAPDSRGRFDEVKALLDGSGLDVAERKTSTAQTPSAKQK